MVGAAVMFIVLLWKWGLWLYRLPLADKKRILFGLPTRRTFSAIGEVVSESLLHRRIFRVNPLLGYMHMSLAFGWFLLIAVGWIETVAYLGFRYVPLQGHVFFKYFSTGLQHKPVFDFLMDLLLLFVLSGVALAWGKRFFSKRMGMRRTTKHVPGDRIALSALWFVFPARLIAESTTCALYGGGGFLTGSLGGWMAAHMSTFVHGDTLDLPAPLQAPLDRNGGVVRQLPGRGLLALRHLYRPLPVAERAGHRQRAVGLFSARPAI